jgi:hypothetical protein
LFQLEKIQAAEKEGHCYAKLCQKVNQITTEKDSEIERLKHELAQACELAQAWEFAQAGGGGGEGEKTEAEGSKKVETFQLRPTVGYEVPANEGDFSHLLTKLVPTVMYSQIVKRFKGPDQRSNTAWVRCVNNDTARHIVDCINNALPNAAAMAKQDLSLLEQADNRKTSAGANTKLWFGGVPCFILLILPLFHAFTFPPIVF